jgi:chemotaxis protein MotB
MCSNDKGIQKYVVFLQQKLNQNLFFPPMRKIKLHPIAIFQIGLILLLAVGLSACVKKSVYQTEVTAHKESAAREKVLQSELKDRKTEAEKMVATIGDLNRTIGKQEGDIADLRARIVQLSTSANQTSAALMEEKQQLERSLSERTAVLNQKEAELIRLRDLIQQRNGALQTLYLTLVETCKNLKDTKVSLTYDGVLVVLPDQGLFDATGVAVSAAGKSMLSPIAQVITERPTLNVSVITYTDNQLPKGNKTLTDTWDWSLRRAVQVTRLLISDYGVNANQLSPVGRGEFFPVATNETPEGRAQNRRTELLLQPRLPEIR